MKTAFRESFERDLKKIKDRKVLNRVFRAIQNVEAAATLADISSLKKMSGAKDYYRIRSGSFRIGIIVEEDTVEFVRCLPRKDLYRYFP